MRCEIIIPVWNQYELTKNCIASVFNHTTFPFHLFIIDNASSEPTRGYLEKLAQEKNTAVTLITNKTNLGFIKAVNLGLAHSTADYACLLNNDTCVSDGWLLEMIKVAEKQEEIGIINPNSNTLGCRPKRWQSVEALARELKSYSGEYSNLAWAGGFCLLIKHKVIQEVGFFDEIYGMGYFEEADFCKRAERLGYLSVCAKAAYVYHHERSSFIKFKRFEQNFERNRQIFYAKWGRLERILYVLTKDNPKNAEKISAEALKLARQGNIIWLFLKAKNIKEINIHSNIYSYRLPRHFFNLVSCWRILKRKKKFDKIYVDDEVYGKRLNRLKSLHKAEVICVQ